jgi:hypothetical protein
VRYPASYGEITTVGRVSDQPGQRLWRQRSIGVQHTDQVGGRREQPSVHSGTVAAPRFGHHRGTAGGRHGDRVVGAAVIDDENPVTRRHRRQDTGQRLGFIQARQHDVDRGSHSR